MAEKEVEEVAEPNEKVVNVHGARAVAPKNRQTWIIWTVIAGFVVLILLVIASIVFVHKVTERVTTANQPNVQIAQRGGFGGYRTSTFYQQSSSTNGPTTTTTTQEYTVTEGVVTQVNSNNIVVAGNGKTQTIATNSSTTYYNNTKPVVNDTVRVEGTADSNNNITATEIEVAND